MTMPQDISALRGRTAVDADGEKIGKIDEVYLDRASDAPEWLTVSTGLFGSRTSFVPIADARVADDEVRLPYRKQQIKDAPNIDADEELSADDERRLYEHYGRSDYGDWADGQRREDLEATNRDEATDRDRPATGRDEIDDPDRGRFDRSDARGEGRPDEAMTRSEEELRVGTTERESGRVRLKKYVVEDQVTQTVPVRREEVRVEREPITDANRDDAVSGPDITEDEHEVVLSAEEPVVEKRTVPQERVRLEKDVHTEEREVSDTVRKERIDVDETAADRH
jgi:uncharacterized protein (TIGR02271 family)